MVGRYIQHIWNPRDPLLRTVFEDRGINLLNVPREGASVGDLYKFNGRTEQVTYPGRIEEFLNPKFKLPGLQNEDEDYTTTISGRLFKNMSSNFGVDFLSGFFKELGTTSNVSATLKSDHISTLDFSFLNVKWDCVNPTSLGGKLAIEHYNFDETNAYYDKESRYYVTTAVFRSSSIKISLKDSEGKNASGKLNTPVVKVSGEVSEQQTKEGDFVYNGKKKLSFGVYLHRLKYDSARGIVLKTPKNVHKTMKPGSSNMHYDTSPVLIGDPNEDD
jgi:hypothetical protein